MSNEQLKFEQLLARHCALALCKQKTANMFHINRNCINDLDEMVNWYNRLFAAKGIKIRIFQSKQQRVMIYVYCPKLVEQLLHDDSVVKLLSKFNYPEDDMEKVFQYLEYRLNTCKTFPHEIGIFLGYPLSDLIGFLQNIPCLYVANWKVYSNVNESKKRFKQFQETKDLLKR